MKLKPDKINIIVELTPEELLAADAYLMLDKELFRANKIQNVIAQSIWGRLLAKMPEKANRHSLLAVSVKWDASKNSFLVTFWNEPPTKETVLS